ncbi:glycoside hydrolase superfamily [Cercophora newfieldiana]|uniref:xylan 1,4-beta-xylosidase n=1 Tax=Cercophora newfieldiana TaxID=92897 RepID=A0AA39YQP4_9PEZI|nr:glycoside hydrolase superfamily [Cercophora newfieldiana]
MWPFRSLLPRLATVAVVGSGLVSGFQFPDCVNGPLSNNTVCDLKATPAGRAAALVKVMNISEKLVNLVDMSRGAQRIGLPPYAWWNEALHGVAASPGVSFDWSGNGSAFSYATSFPNTISMAAAFDDEMIYKIGEVISTEARAFINAGRSGLEFWTPNVNPYKDPRWGRGHETPGEDPVRIKGFTKALLAGLEGTGSIRKVIATCKHFAGYDLERWKGAVRHRFNAVISSQDLSEYYLPPFQQCARDSKVGSFMCSYNALNGTPACASTYLMDDILRKHWNWTEHNNFITSDCNAVQDFLPIQHNFTQTPAEAAAIALEAGTDTICEVPEWPPLSDIVGAYNQTLLSEATIDKALKRLYEGLIRAGYFDPASSSPYRSIGWSDVNTPEAQALAYKSAVDGLVLLKNDGTLPLKLQRKSLALIGFWANPGLQMLGGYSGIPPYLHSAVYAAQQLNMTYYAQPGPPARAEASANSSWIAPTLSAADRADVIVYFGGTDTTVASEDTDRESIAWPSAQLSLINRLATLGKPLIVVHLGDQVDDTPLLTNPNVSAIIWAGYPGQSGGAAVLDLIRGKVAPAGRLPVTQYPAKYVDQIPMTEMALRPKTNQPGRTYRWYSDAVLPFGYGLHYTNFTTALLPPIPPSPSLLSGCTTPHPDLCPFATVPLTVTNTGQVKSDYVALLFLSGTFGPAPYPIKTLVGYTRLRGIEPGKTAKGEIHLTAGSIARTDASGNLVLYPGVYRLALDVDGGSEVGFALEGGEQVLDWFPQPKTQPKTQPQAQQTGEEGGSEREGKGDELPNLEDWDKKSSEELRMVDVKVLK